MAARTMTLEEANRIAQERIAELEAELMREREQSAHYLRNYNQARDTLTMLEAENERLREGLVDVCEAQRWTDLILEGE